MVSMKMRATMNFTTMRVHRSMQCHIKPFTTKLSSNNLPKEMLISGNSTRVKITCLTIRLKGK